MLPINYFNLLFVNKFIVLAITLLKIKTLKSHVYEIRWKMQLGISKTNKESSKIFFIVLDFSKPNCYLKAIKFSQVEEHKS